MNECITCRTISQCAAASRTKTRGGETGRTQRYCLKRQQSSFHSTKDEWVHRQCRRRAEAFPQQSLLTSCPSLAVELAVILNVEGLTYRNIINLGLLHQLPVAVQVQVLFLFVAVCRRQVSNKGPAETDPINLPPLLSSILIVSQKHP